LANLRQPGLSSDIFNETHNFTALPADTDSTEALPGKSLSSLITNYVLCRRHSLLNR